MGFIDKLFIFFLGIILGYLCRNFFFQYHPDLLLLLVLSFNYSNIDGITGFSEEDSQSVFSFMRFAVELAKSGDGLVLLPIFS